MRLAAMHASRAEREPTDHGAVLEQLSTIPTLKKEALSLGHAREVSSEADDLSRSDERREMSELGENPAHQKRAARVSMNWAQRVVIARTDFSR